MEAMWTSGHLGTVGAVLGSGRQQLVVVECVGF